MSFGVDNKPKIKGLDEENAEKIEALEERISIIELKLLSDIKRKLEESRGEYEQNKPGIWRQK